MPQHSPNEGSSHNELLENQMSEVHRRHELIPGNKRLLRRVTQWPANRSLTHAVYATPPVDKKDNSER